MFQDIRLERLLDRSGEEDRRLELFGLILLGLLVSLDNGLLSAEDAVRLFFNADNALFVRKTLKDKTADEIMSRGAQLPDLFEALPTGEAHREFQRELGTMRVLCLRLLDSRQLVA
jgi:hypothetical protein